MRRYGSPDFLAHGSAINLSVSLMILLGKAAIFDSQSLRGCFAGGCSPEVRLAEAGGYLELGVEFLGSKDVCDIKKD
jgi:hypothetical protein